MADRNIEEETGHFKLELIRERGKQHRASALLYMRFVITLALGGVAVFLYYLAFSRDVDQMTVA